MRTVKVAYRRGRRRVVEPVQVSLAGALDAIRDLENEAVSALGDLDACDRHDLLIRYARDAACLRRIVRDWLRAPATSAGGTRRRTRRR